MIKRIGELKMQMERMKQAASEMETSLRNEITELKEHVENRDIQIEENTKLIDHAVEQEFKAYDHIKKVSEFSLTCIALDS